MLSQRQPCNQEGAGLVQHMKAPEQAQEDTSPGQVRQASAHLGTNQFVTLTTKDTTLDHSQQTVKVCFAQSGGRRPIMCRQQLVLLIPIVCGNTDQRFARLFVVESQNLAASR